jgi:hypothetical protein
MTWRGEVEDGTGWGGLVPTKAERESGRQAAQRPGTAEAHYGLTVAIQHLNSSPYNLTKAECIELLRTLRDGA